MELAFECKELRALCEIKLLGIERFGDELAFNFRARLDDVGAAIGFSDILLGEPQIIHEPELNIHVLKISIGKTSKLVFAANHINNPLADDNTIDWNRVTRVRLLKIED